MDKPIIGISGSIINAQNNERDYANNEYISAVEIAGGIPIIIPVISDEESIKKQISIIDGLILTGGGDPDPIIFGEEPMIKLGSVWPKRDKFDSSLIKYAIESNKPILGVCRGLQIMNVVFGGSLYQDTSYIEGCNIKHMQSSDEKIPTHAIVNKDGTKLYDILGNVVRVNSLHHMAIKDVAPDFIVSSVSKDGIIEGIEKKGDLFVIGVQFHPEILAKEYEFALNIFKKFVEEAKNRL